MIELLLTAMLIQAATLLTGLSIMQILSFGRKISLRLSLPYAWGFGLLYIYIAGGVVSQMATARGMWHLILSGLAIMLMASALYIRKRADKKESCPKIGFPIKWYEIVILLMILFKVSTSLYVLLVNPVIDADGANPFRWTGLAKSIHSEGMIPEDARYMHKLPSLIPAWTAMFLDRWRDNLATLPWFFTWLSIIAVAFISTFKLLKNRWLSLVAAYILSSASLIVIHIMRPGYSDIFIAYFFICAVSWTFEVWEEGAWGKGQGSGEIKTRSFSTDPFAIYYAIIFALGCPLTKKEGFIWFVWILFVLVSLYLNVNEEMQWKKILTVQFISAVVLYGVYFFSSEWILSTFTLERQFTFIFTKNYDPGAILIFWKEIFIRSSFNLIWWFTFISMAFLLLKKRTSEHHKVFIFYMIALILGVFYYACFTGNLPFTTNSTNVGRFIMQIYGLFLPVYIMLLKYVNKEKAIS